MTRTKQKYEVKVKPDLERKKKEIKKTIKFKQTNKKPMVPKKVEQWFQKSKAGSSIFGGSAAASKPSSGYSFGIGSTTSVKEADKKDDEEKKKPTTSVENGLSKTPATDEKSEATKPSSGFSFGIGSTTSVKEADKKGDKEKRKPTTSVESGLSKTPAADEKSEATKPSSGFSFGIGSTTSVKEADKKEDEEKKEKLTTSAESEKPKSGGFDFSGLTAPADEKKSEGTKPASSGGFDFSGLNKTAAASSAAKKWTCS